MGKMIGIGAAIVACANLALAEHPGIVSEGDFLADMPIVLSVSRLPQRLDDTPGAVTVIDREMIRLSGVRDVAELMRWVPGFQSSTSFEVDAPTVSYHGAFGEFTSRVQVLIDGRSDYSTYLTGSIGAGLQTVALADIERIEVLRGSNSAAYGARAFLGVINVVTRHPVDTLGWQLSAAAGQNGVRDGLARLGWGSDVASYRLTLDQRGDDGLNETDGDPQVHRFSKVQRVNFRADLRPTPSDEIQLRIGQININAGVGRVGDINRPDRDRSTWANYGQLDWQHSLGADEDIALSLSHSQEALDDSFPFSLVALKRQSPVISRVYPQLGDVAIIDYSGAAGNDTVSLQHTFRHGSDLRVVWGGELRREHTKSKALYATNDVQITDFKRLFGNVEWRIKPAWVLNAGGMFERSSKSDDNFSPRLMLNWHFADGHTLRAGGTRAHRPPSLFEKQANLLYSADGVPLQSAVVSSGKVQPENVKSRELGYLGHWPQANVNLDVRLFNEVVGGMVRREINRGYVFPAGTVIRRLPFDYTNGPDIQIRGLEYQLKWRPFTSTQLVINQAYTRLDSLEPDRLLDAPRLASSLMLFQKLPSDLDLSFLYYRSTDVIPPASGRPDHERGDDRMPVKRTDMRLSKAMRFGSHKGELALVLQNLGKPYADYESAFRFERRAFVTLRIEN